MDPTTTRSQLHIYRRFYAYLGFLINYYQSFISASIMLTQLLRNVSRQDIECPGDTISYRCSIQSNSEPVQLRWMVTFPGLDTIMILYTNDSDRNRVTYLDMNITTTLTQYRSDEFIQSEIVLAVLQNVSMNGKELECSSENLASEVLITYVNTSGM